MTIRIVLAEDHTIVRQGLRALLSGQGDIEIVGEAVNGREAVALAVAEKPDVVLMDLGMPELNGIDASVMLSKKLPQARVLILSMHAGEEYVRPALRAGVAGYLLKGSDLSDLVTAIREVAAGQSFFSPSVANLIRQDQKMREQKSNAHNAGALSLREREVLQLIAEGYTGPQIAGHLGISSKTVDAHRARIMRKLHIHDIAGLVRYALRTGLVPPEL